MKLTGSHLIGFKEVKGNTTFKSVNPINGMESSCDYAEATLDHTNAAADLAEQAFDVFRHTSSIKKAELLKKMADEIMNIGDKLINQVHLETGLPLPRVQGERERTCGQLLLFSELLKEGSWVNASIDHADTNRTPLAKPDTRSMQTALGPVVVFGASNFPLAFSVAGGDTASALAAGCPVIVKGHPAHPGTSELIAKAVLKAVRACDLPEGVFSLIQSSNYQTSEYLVKHPKIKAVGFTGSLKAGRHLYNIATSRPEPIAFYGELGSINPVFLLQDALNKNTNALAQNYINSLTLGCGQFCTNPGLLIVEESPNLASFLELLSIQLRRAMTGPMLTQNIQKSLKQGIEFFKSQDAVTVMASTTTDDTQTGSQNMLLSVSASSFINNPNLHEELFGPVGIVVICKNSDDILRVADCLKGQLTATIHTTNTQKTFTRILFNKLTQMAGRVLFNGFPTGVEVNRSMVHGGCYPATTDSRSTSVGTQAIYRFTRPLCYQDTPEYLLPSALKNNNPLKIYRMIDGVFTNL